MLTTSSPALNRFWFSQRGWFRTVDPGGCWLLNIMIVNIFTVADFSSARIRTSQFALYNRWNDVLSPLFLLFFHSCFLLVDICFFRLSPSPITHLVCPSLELLSVLLFSLHKLYLCVLFSLAGLKIEWPWWVHGLSVEEDNTLARAFCKYLIKSQYSSIHPHFLLHLYSYITSESILN